MLKHITKSTLLKGLLTLLSIMAMGIIVGCTSGFAEPFDISNIYYNYTTVSGSDGEYVVITKHLVSQSDVKIPDAIYGIPVKEIADSVFAEDKQIKTVTFGKNMRRIGSNAFGHCTNLQSVTFNVSMSDIGDYSFQGCTGLQEMSFPDHLASVGRGAFYGCTSLIKLAVPNGIQHIGGMAFGNTAWLSARAGDEFVYVGDGILIAYNGDKEKLKLPKNVRLIAGAFAGNTNLKSVTLREGLTAIGDMAFMGCHSLTEVNIPSTVTEIGSNAFYGCSSVEKLIIPARMEYIGPDAFTNCRAALFVKEGAYAEKYCADNGLDCFTSK